MKVYRKTSQAPIDLTAHDLVGQGGQGNVYSKGGSAFKVYHNPKDMLPLGKIQELATIDDEYVITPKDVLMDSRGKSIGGYAVCPTCGRKCLTGFCWNQDGSFLCRPRLRWSSPPDTPRPPHTPRRRDFALSVPASDLLTVEC